MKPQNFLFLTLLILILKLSFQTGTVEILSEDSKYFNLEYSSLFKIPTSMMTLFSTGGERSGFELSKAIDNKWNTHWRSEGEQGTEYTNPTTGVTYDSLVNSIIITFSTTVVLDKMIFKTDNCNGCEGIGYPTELKVYSKLKSDSNDVLNPYDESNFTLIDDSNRNGKDWTKADGFFWHFMTNGVAEDKENELTSLMPFDIIGRKHLPFLYPGEEEKRKTKKNKN